jgi:hypothetical protein
MVNDSIKFLNCYLAIMWYLGLTSIAIEVPISQSRMLSFGVLL